MAKAMEKWLKSGEAATRIVKGPKEENRENTKEKKDGDREDKVIEKT